MKESRSSNRISIVFWFLALAVVVILLTIPLLAKGISLIISDPIEPEKLDIRPIPVPVPPPPLVSNQPLSSGTPNPSSVVVPLPVAIAVPKPPGSVQAQAALAQPSTIELPTASTIKIINRQGVFLMAFALLVLLTWLWLQRTPNVHSLPKECTG